MGSDELGLTDTNDTTWAPAPRRLGFTRMSSIVNPKAGPSTDTPKNVTAFGPVNTPGYVVPRVVTKSGVPLCTTDVLKNCWTFTREGPTARSEHVTVSSPGAADVLSGSSTGTDPTLATHSGAAADGTAHAVSATNGSHSRQPMNAPMRPFL